MAVSEHKPLPISVEGVTKRYGTVLALDRVSIQVRAGDFVTLLGPSGSGKTSLLMVMAGFLRPDAGSLRFGDRQMLLEPPHRRNVGMVFQNYALFPHMSVLANVMFPLTVRGIGRKAAAVRAESALELVDLSGYGARATHELSGGQQQRVALARAIVFEPPILLMDEPLSALDKNLRERMQIEIRQLHRRLGMTTVYVTHDQREALTMSDRVAILNRGRIEQYATPEQIYDQPGSAFVADFMGETSLIPVRIEDGKAVFANHQLVLPSMPSGHDGYSLVLRPERLVLLEYGRGAPDGSNLISGQVADRVFQGESLLYLISFSDGEQFTYRAQGKSSGRERMPEPGMMVNFALDVEDTLVVPRPL